MNPLEGIAQILSLPFRAVGQFIQSLPPPPGLPRLADILPPLPPFMSGLSSLGATYNNLEEWEVQRNAKGRITGLVVHRDARVN
jgi:hypothetical protein